MVEHQIIQTDVDLTELAKLLAMYDTLAESHAELVEALDKLLNCRWVKETASHEVNLARTALLKARALVPEAKA